MDDVPVCLITRIAKLVFALLCVLLGPEALPADTSAPSPIATDRPAVTDSSVVVPIGALVVENGLAATVNQGEQVFDASETLLRLGVAAKTELRLTVPDYFNSGTAGWGFGDMALGVKQQLGPIHGFDVSLVATLTLPTGSHNFSSHGYDPSLQLPWSRSLSANWTAAGMFSVYWLTINGHHNTTGESTFLVDRQLTKPWDAFVEYVGDFPQSGGPRHLLHLGTAYKVSNNQQVDLHVGVGLSPAAAAHYIGLGYSFKLQMFKR